MDPDAALRDIIDAYNDGDDPPEDICAGLADWIDMGGFPPEDDLVAEFEATTGLAFTRRTLRRLSGDWV